MVYGPNATQPAATGCGCGYGCCASARSSSSAICREPPLAILTAEGHAKKQTNTQANKQTNVLLVLVQRPRESDTSHGTGRHANDGYCCERSAAHPAELSVRWPGAAAAGGAYNRRHARGTPRRAHATHRLGKMRRDATATCALRDEAAGVACLEHASAVCAQLSDRRSHRRHARDCRQQQWAAAARCVRGCARGRRDSERHGAHACALAAPGMHRAARRFGHVRHGRVAEGCAVRAAWHVAGRAPRGGRRRPPHRRA